MRLAEKRRLEWEEMQERRAAEAAEQHRRALSGVREFRCRLCYEAVREPVRHRYRIYKQTAAAVCAECRARLCELTRGIPQDIEFIELWRALDARAQELAAQTAERSELDGAPRAECPFCLGAGTLGFGYAIPDGLEQHLRRCRVAEEVRSAWSERTWNRGAQRGEDEPEVDRSGFVYLIRDETRGHVKIGLSKQPERRVRDLSAAHSVPLVLICAAQVKDAKEAETRLHNQFAHLRLNGEWFTDAPEIHRAFQEMSNDAAA